MRLIDAGKFILALMDASLSSVDKDTIFDLVDSISTVAAVPVSALRALREDLYSNDLISMEGLRQLNALIAMHEGGVADG